MRYRVEYLKTIEDTDSVCDVRYLYVDELHQAASKAREDGPFEHRWAGATAFRVRDQFDHDRIVVTEDFSDLVVNTA